MKIVNLKEYMKEYGRKWRENNKEKSREYQKEWDKNNPEYHKVYGKVWRGKNKESIKEIKKIWAENNKDKLTKASRKHYENFPEKQKARILALKIELKSCCEICDSTEHLQRHHWRYDKPLLVNTLCNDCHTIQHIKS